MSTPIKPSSRFLASSVATLPHSNSESEQSEKHSKEKEASTSSSSLSSSSERVAASALADLIGTEVEKVSNPMDYATLEDVKVSDESVNLLRRINQRDKNKKKLAPGPIDPMTCTKLESISKIPS